MNLIRVLLGAPGNPAEARRVFHEAVAECNHEEALARGTLFVPLFTARKMYDQAVIDENLRTCRYFLLALEQGGRADSFQHDLQFALACRAEANLPMEEVVALRRRAASETGGLRDDLKTAPEVRQLEFGDAGELKAILRSLLSDWLRDAAPASQRAQS